MSWGIARPNVKREDGTAWSRCCFIPRETCEADLLIDLTKCRVSITFLDSVAYKAGKLVLETITAVPDMVGRMLLHLKFLLIAGARCSHANYCRLFNNEHINMTHSLVLIVPYDRGSC
ncbi:hypothetical protein NE237_032179 [Protea cynaroides]|uniref:Uncharacterized protein n=1 Tax=Protea cynaroides TaxID=273540 RepID=A0A9Q0R378_9MAGN|nr:hypothetical protein NE237_032179 [Protea cynaroides]